MLCVLALFFLIYQAITNFKNTVHGFKKFHGRAFDDPFVQAEKNKLPYSLHKLANGSAGIKVKHFPTFSHPVCCCYCRSLSFELSRDAEHGEAVCCAHP